MHCNAANNIHFHKRYALNYNVQLLVIQKMVNYILYAIASENCLTSTPGNVPYFIDQKEIRPSRMKKYFIIDSFL